MNENRPLPMGIPIGIIIVFVAMVLGVCFLIVFFYNLPVIFPPPGANPRALGLATITPAPLPSRASPTITPLISGGLGPASPTVPASTATATPTLGPVAAPNSGRIVFVTERNGFNSIYLMSSDGTGQRLLVPHKGNFYDYAPAVSPDGRQLAFSSNREGPGTDNIYLMNLDGAEFTKITSTPNAKNASSSWFPDGRRLAFASNRTGRWQGFTMNADGSNVRPLLTSNQEIIDLAVSPNGNTIAYTCGREICLANPDGANSRVLLQNGLPKDHLAWSPDSSL